MKRRTEKTIALAAIPASISLIAAGFMGATAAIAVPAPDASPSPVSQSGAPSATTQTVPWCGWTIQNLPANVTMSDDAATEDAPSKYKGTAITLVGTADDIQAFVGGSDTYSDNADNCSWFNDANKQGLVLDVAASGVAFTASAATGGTDTAMGFSLSESNPLSITPAYGDDCAAGFTTDTDLSIYADHTTTIPVRTAATSGVTTISVCTWSLDYETTIPAGMSPKFGDELYTFTGPTLTTTVAVG